MNTAADLVKHSVRHCTPVRCEIFAGSLWAMCSVHRGWSGYPDLNNVLQAAMKYHG